MRAYVLAPALAGCFIIGGITNSVWGATIGFGIGLTVGIWLQRQDERRLSAPKKKGVMVSKETGGAYADQQEVIEDEIKRITTKSASTHR